MGVSNELARPVTDEDFEALCYVLYGLVHKDYTFTRVGGPGQKQFGVDILGQDGPSSKGIQCKHYNKKPFTLATVKADIEKVEESNLKIKHLLFATTAASKSEVVKEVLELSVERQNQGKFSVSVNFWEDISNYIRLFPEVGKNFIPGFSGSTILEIQETTGAHLELYEADRINDSQFQSISLDNQEKILQQLNILQQNLMPQARGDEADPLVVASLDSVRDKLREGKCREAADLLKTLGDPTKFKDEFSRFRWYTNSAFVELLEGRYENAAEGFLNAFKFAPEDEKALSNKTHALILKKSYQDALIVCEDGLAKFPKSELLWSLKINILQSLGDLEPEKYLPEALRNSSDILFSLANLKHIKGDFQAALELLRKCMLKDGGTFNAKRVYLADALSWCTLDPVLALHGQLTKEQREVLKDALNRFEPLEKTLPAIQSDHISEELVSNALFSLILLDDRSRAYALTNNLLVRHPLLESLLRIKLQELDENNDIKAIHDLTDYRLTELPTPVIGILTEFAANQGDIAWYDQLIQIAETTELESNRLESLRTLSIQAEWKSGNKANAIEMARKYLDGNAQHILTRVALAQMLNEFGSIDDAINEALIALNYLTDDANTLQLLQVAELLYRLQQFSEASIVFSKLVKTYSNDEFTRKLLICLIESDQRRKARDILDQLPPEVQQLSEFQRIEANLARRMGDWARMRDLLAAELSRHPHSARVAISYVGALFRLSDKKTAEAYLKSDPKFKDSTPENEFEFSKYQAHEGFTNLAINRLYRLYRDNSSSSQAASFYLCQILIGKHFPELEAPTKIGDGCTVHLRNAAGVKCVAIDIEKSNSQSWPELISPQAEISKILHGLKPGDHAALDNGLSKSDFEIESIESIYSFASRKAQELISATAEPAGPLYSVRVIRDDGTPDIQALLDSAQQRKEHVQRIFDNYKQYRFPISMLARALGTDPVTLLLEWPFKDVSLFVGSGTHQERDYSVKLLEEKNHRFVLDLLTIAELVQRKCFDSVIKLIGRPFIPTTVQEHLLIVIEAASAPQASSSLGASDGHLIMTDTPSQYYEDRLAFLYEMQSCLDKYCDIVATAGPREITETHRLVAEAVDNDSLDAIYLSIEKDAILVSEDGALRLLAIESGVSKSMGLQPILMEACDTKLISKDTYANVVFDKVVTGHDFVSIRAEDMFTIAKRTPYRVSETIKLGLDTFRKPTLDMVSGVRVCCEFVIMVILNIQARIAVKYIRHILEVLQYQRPELAQTIQKAISIAILAAFENPLCKLKPRDRRAFEEFLVVDNVSPKLNQRRLIPVTVQQLFYRKS